MLQLNPRYEASFKMNHIFPQPSYITSDLTEDNKELRQQIDKLLKQI